MGLFPLLYLNSGKSLYLDEEISLFHSRVDVHKKKVNYKFLKGGNSMLKVNRE